MWSSCTLVTSVLCLTAWHFCAQTSASDPPPQFHLSHAKLPWAQFMRTTRPSSAATLLEHGESNPQRCVGVQESDVVQWIERSSSGSEVPVAAAVNDDDDDDDGGGDGDDGAELPAALTVPGASVWVPAVPVATLVWKGHSDEQPFFQSRGCYRAFSLNGALESYGPLSCFQKCVQSGKRMPLGSVMFLQRERCFCLGPEDWRRQAEHVGPSSCSLQCAGEDHLCGGHQGHFSVYDLPSVDFPMGKLDKRKCFTGTFAENGARLVIAQQSCLARSVAICVRTQPLLSLSGSPPAATLYQEGQGYCSGASYGDLPSKIPGRSVDESIRILYALFYNDHRFTADQLHHRTFWLGLEFKTTHRWTGEDETKGREQTQIKRGAGAECSALTRNRTHVLLQTVGCDTPLPFLTNCQNGELLGSTTKEIKPEDIQTATAVGLTGLLCLVIFVILALVLFVLKRSGRLHIRQKPAFHSTGEWDEESVAARVHREAYLADLQARLSVTRGLELQHLPATNQKPATPAAASVPNSRHAAPRPVVSEYSDPKPLRDVDYANVTPLPDDDGANGNHYEMMSEARVTTATSLTTATTSVVKKSHTPAVSIEVCYQDDGIYAEPMEEWEAGDEADDMVTLVQPDLQRTALNGLAQDTGGHFLHPPTSSKNVPTPTSSPMPRTSRHDYEEAVTSPLKTASSIKRAHSDVGLLPQRAEEADDLDSDMYSVPFEAAPPPPHPLSNGATRSPHTSGDPEAIPAYCVSPVSPRKMGEDKVSGGEEEGSVPEEAGVAQGERGMEEEEGGGGGVSHTVGPKGDLYARPAKSGVVVVSLKKTANKTL